MTDILQSCAILAVALAVLAQAISIKRLHEDIESQAESKQAPNTVVSNGEDK